MFTRNWYNDGTNDYGDLNTKHTEYVIFDCFINLHIGTIEYAKLMHSIIEMFDIEDEQIPILNVTKNNLNGKLWIMMTAITTTRIIIMITMKMTNSIKFCCFRYNSQNLQNSAQSNNGNENNNSNNNSNTNNGKRF